MKMITRAEAVIARLKEQGLTLATAESCTGGLIGKLLTDVCRRVLDFTPQRICLDMGDTLVTLYGADLRIESFAGKRLIAAGRFARIELRCKWEVPQE